VGSLKVCINCGNESHHLHHVVPKVLGGSDGQNLVPLCETCHGLVHDKNYLNHKELQRAGIEKAKKEGKYTGRKNTINRLKVCLLNSQGLKPNEIADALDIHRQSVWRILHKEGLKGVKVKLKQKGQT
jgi:hypothetical protein